MLFDYNFFIDELKENEEKKETVEKYTRFYGPQDDVDIYDTVFYKDYLAKFDIPFEMVVPEDIANDFNWDLLGKLIFGSYSSNYELAVEKRETDAESDKDENEKPLVRVYIKVRSGEQEIVKELSELWSFQFLRLFEIYIEEQMGYYIIMAEEAEEAKEDEDEEEDNLNAIKEEQDAHLQLFKRKVKRIMKQPGLRKELEDLL